MGILYLALIFVLILVLMLGFCKPLWLAASAASLAAIFLYGIGWGDAARIVGTSLISKSTVEMLLVIYLVNLIQVMMQKKGTLLKAEKSMENLLRSQRAIVTCAPIFMGLLPAPNAVLLSAPMVENAAGDDLNAREKAFVTSYLRHIPESILPLYPGLLLAFQVTDFSSAQYLAMAMPLVALVIVFVYFTTIRKITDKKKEDIAGDKKPHFIELIKALWPVILLIVLALFSGIPTSLVCLFIVVLLAFSYRLPLNGYGAMLKQSFQVNMICGMAMVMVFKDLIAFTGVISEFTEVFAVLPIPAFLIYALIVFFCGLAGLSNAAIATIFPIAFATVPNAGMPLFVLLMSFSHAAAQLSPTHFCLEVAVGYFKIPMGQLIKKTIPVTVVYCTAAVLYYLVLNGI